MNVQVKIVEGWHVLLFLFYRLKVGVEDGQSEDNIPVILEVATGMTIAQLKDKVLMWKHTQRNTRGNFLLFFYYYYFLRKYFLTNLWYITHIKPKMELSYDLLKATCEVFL